MKMAIFRYAIDKRRCFYPCGLLNLKNNTLELTISLNNIKELKLVRNEIELLLINKNFTLLNKDKIKNLKKNIPQKKYSRKLPFNDITKIINKKKRRINKNINLEKAKTLSELRE